MSHSSLVYLAKTYWLLYLINKPLYAKAASSNNKHCMVRILFFFKSSLNTRMEHLPNISTISPSLAIKFSQVVKIKFQNDRICKDLHNIFSDIFHGHSGLYLVFGALLFDLGAKRGGANVCHTHSECISRIATQILWSPWISRNIHLYL